MDMKKIFLLVIFITINNSALALKLPKEPYLKYSDQNIIQCITSDTKILKESFNKLENEVYKITKHYTSVEPIILEQRRIQENWCKTEAKCIADATQENKELIYGQIFLMCIQEISK